MAFDQLILIHPESKIIKKAPVGFSWTNLLFGLWVPLLRSDFRNFFRQWGLSIITLSIYALISPFRYNRIYTQKLLTEGYKVQTVIKGSPEGLLLSSLQLADLPKA